MPSNTSKPDRRRPGCQKAEAFKRKPRRNISVRSLCAVWGTTHGQSAVWDHGPNRFEFGYPSTDSDEPGMARRDGSCYGTPRPARPRKSKFYGVREAPQKPEKKKTSTPESRRSARNRSLSQPTLLAATSSGKCASGTGLGGLVRRESPKAGGGASRRRLRSSAGYANAFP